MGSGDWARLQQPANALCGRTPFPYRREHKGGSEEREGPRLCRRPPPLHHHSFDTVPLT